MVKGKQVVRFSELFLTKFINIICINNNAERMYFTNNKRTYVQIVKVINKIFTIIFTYGNIFYNFKKFLSQLFSKSWIC